MFFFWEPWSTVNSLIGIGFFQIMFGSFPQIFALRKKKEQILPPPPLLGCARKLVRLHPKEYPHLQVGYIFI